MGGLCDICGASDFEGLLDGLDRQPVCAEAVGEVLSADPSLAATVGWGR